MENRFIIFKTSVTYDVRDMKFNQTMGKFTSFDAAKKFRDRIEAHMTKLDMKRDLKRDGMQNDFTERKMTLVK